MEANDGQRLCLTSRLWTKSDQVRSEWIVKQCVITSGWFEEDALEYSLQTLTQLRGGWLCSTHDSGRTSDFLISSNVGGLEVAAVGG